MNALALTLGSASSSPAQGGGGMNTLALVKPSAKPVRVGLLNPNFIYVPAAQTDIRVRFEAIRAAAVQKEKKVKTK